MNESLSEVLPNLIMQPQQYVDENRGWASKLNWVRDLKDGEIWNYLGNKPNLQYSYNNT